MATHRYERDIKLTGLIYLHRITDIRMKGAPLSNLRMFAELCGDVAMHQVILISTMWQEEPESEKALLRESELKTKFWKPLIDRGSRVDRLERSNSEESWRIVEQLIELKEEREPVLLQEELVELQRKLNETQAGKTLYTTLQKALDRQREDLKLLLDQLGKSDDPSLRQELRKEYERIEQDFQRTFKDVKKLKIPLGRRIMTFFGKQARAVSVFLKRW